MRKAMMAVVFLPLLLTPAQSQTPPEVAQTSAAPADAVAPAPVCCAIPALTVVDIEILATMNSQANHIGEKFPIRLAKPIVVDGKILVPAGATGSGDVVHAAKSRFGGKAGEMILAVRYLEHGGVRIPLRSLRAGVGQGQDNSSTAAAAAIAGGAVGGVLSMFITGGEVNVPAGTMMTAKTSADALIPQAASPQQVTTGGTTTP
jgi:hypothetical protein